MEQDALLVDTDPDSPSKESEKNITRQSTIVETFNAKASAKLHESKGYEHKMCVAPCWFRAGYKYIYPSSHEEVYWPNQSHFGFSNDIEDLEAESVQCFLINRSVVVISENTW